MVYGAACARGAEHGAAWALLSLLLREEAGLASLPGAARTALGKPYFPDRPDLCFSLSHSRGFVVCALHDRPVGVDVEFVRPAPRLLAGGLADEEFFRLWTRREAAVKRDGGSAAVLRRSFPPDPLSRNIENFLPGCAAAVCPAREAEVRAVVIDAVSAPA